MAFTFVHPSNILLCGPTGCGKTWFVERILRNRLFQPWPNHVYWYYAEWQPAYERLQTELGGDISFENGIPGGELVPGCLVVIDDQMDAACNSKFVSTLFTRGSHHRNVSVMLLMQNMFLRSKECRTLSLNAQYFVLFKSPRDKSQIRALSQQMYPHSSRFLVQSFEDATNGCYGYLVINMRADADENMRVMSKIFPDEGHCQVYLPI